MGKSRAGLKACAADPANKRIDSVAHRRLKAWSFLRRPSGVRTGQQNPEVIDGPVGEVECEKFLGGLLKSYHRAAA